MRLTCSLRRLKMSLMFVVRFRRFNINRLLFMKCCSLEHLLRFRSVIPLRNTRRVGCQGRKRRESIRWRRVNASSTFDILIRFRMWFKVVLTFESQLLYSRFRLRRDLMVVSLLLLRRVRLLGIDAFTLCLGTSVARLGYACWGDSMSGRLRWFAGNRVILEWRMRG